MHSPCNPALTALPLLIALVIAFAPTAARPEPDARPLAQRLADTLRFETISHQDRSRFQGEPFDRLNDYLRATYPRTYAALKTERVNGYSLLLEWTGSDSSLPPALFLSHTDVVPIEPGTEEGWTHPPFDGTIADGYIWGRGTLDVKSGVTGYHEAIERLLEQGFSPRRSLYFAFGHDEEVGGTQGAAEIARTFAERGIHFEFAVDEGGFIIEDSPQLPGRTVAAVNVAEKTYFTIYLTARGPGGHSSMPPPHTAIGKLATALHRLEANPMPTKLCGPVREQIERMAPAFGWGQRLAMQNLWATASLVMGSMAEGRVTGPLVRTTTAVTMVSGGVKENVVPQEARGTVNFRILPCETTDDVLAHVRRVIDDPEIEIESGPANPAARPGRVDTRAWELLEESIQTEYPDAMVVPGMIPGATDTRHYRDLADDIYRFIGIKVSMEDVGGAHGTDERVGVESYAAAIRIATETLRRAGQ